MSGKESRRARHVENEYQISCLPLRGPEIFLNCLLFNQLGGKRNGKSGKQHLWGETGRLNNPPACVCRSV